VPEENATTWIKPKLVGEVKFTEWTRDGQMRHPAFVGLRDDKRAKDVIREKAIASKG
jgi:bifunctional non-homologous end joining protein LigD